MPAAFLICALKFSAQDIGHRRSAGLYGLARIEHVDSRLAISMGQCTDHRDRWPAVCIFVRVNRRLPVPDSIADAELPLAPITAVSESSGQDRVQLMAGT